MKDVKPNLAYEFIRKRILSGEFRPGYPLLTEQLSAAIGVSRTPVTEALLKLQADGLVTIKPRLGASVKTLDINELCEVCDMRLALEAHAAGRAALRRTESDLLEMRLALDLMRQLSERIISAREGEVNPDDTVNENLQDIRFHIAIMAAAKNGLMRKEILRLHLINRVVAWPTIDSGAGLATQTKAEEDANRRAVMASHQEIYEAISRRDSAAAKASMERHIEDIINKLLARMQPSESAKNRALTPEELAYVG